MKEIDEAIEAIGTIVGCWEDCQADGEDCALIRQQLELVAKAARREALNSAARRVGSLYSTLRLMEAEATDPKESTDAQKETRTRPQA